MLLTNPSFTQMDLKHKTLQAFIFIKLVVCKFASSPVFKGLIDLGHL